MNKNATIQPFLNAILKDIYYPFVKYRIHISAIFFVMVLGVFKLSDHPVSWPVVFSFAIWHFALYLFDRAFDFDKDKITQPDEAVKPFEQKFVLYLSIVMAFIPVGILYFYNLRVWPYLFFIPVTFLYTYPLVGGIRAKNILIFKNFYSAFFIWTLPLLVVSVFYLNVTSGILQFYFQNYLGLFIYVMAGEAFWDIRDTEGDRIHKVHTLPNTIGILYSKIYIYILILTDFLFVSRAVSDSFLIYCFLLIFIDEKSPRWLFHLPPLLAFFRFVMPNLLHTMF